MNLMRNLKNLRPDPSVIYPGDEIAIPTKVMKNIAAKQGEVVVCRVVKEKRNCAN